MLFDLSRRPLVFGHRGSAGTAPENTLLSFREALECGADVLELDVHATRDGVVVVLHDPTLDRTTDGTGEVRLRSWEEVRGLDAGYRFTRDGTSYPFRGRGLRVPSLEEVFAEFPDARFNIEVKQEDPPIAREVVSLVERFGVATRVLLAAEKDSVMREIRRHARDRIATGFPVGEVVEFLERLDREDFSGYRPAGKALQVPVRFGGRDIVTAESVRAAHELGIEVHPWTINDRAEMEALFDLGVDGLVTDLPALAREILRTRRAG
ncbi:MAG: glycerophosphoryl diester phosphodiesterase [Candidatus Binatia bacterium]|nr:MAG: glycerophosphoryl diester phosphodiesterase [Candidatus Binatia bacterium]